MLLRITPGNKRLEKLINEQGAIWRFKKYSPKCPLLDNDPGYYVESLDESYVSWVESVWVEEIADVS